MKRFFLLFLLLLHVSHAWSQSSAVKPGRSSTTEYCTGFDHDSYTPYLPPGQIQRDAFQHGMVWKHLVNPDLGFNLPGPSFPTGIREGDADVFQALEAGGTFFDTTTGNSVDPVGNWSEVSIEDPETAAVFAAISIWAWSTPVYFNFIGVPASDADGLFNDSFIGITHCVTLSVQNSTTPPHIACGWDAADADDMLNQVINCPNLIIENVEMSYINGLFFDGTGAEYVQADPDYPPIDGDLFAFHYGAFEDTVVIDPPSINASTPLNDIQQILQISEILGSQALLRTSNGLLDRRSGLHTVESVHRE